jgi:hypothetical protein
MGIQLKNNAVGYLATAISASDTGAVLQTGNGASFPALGAGDYFYATLESTGGAMEVVKVTARSGDSLTIARAQEGTTAQSFAAGSRFELRVTAQGYLDIFAEASALRADLAAASGSSLVGFLQAGASAVARTTQVKLREIVSVLDFGADPTGVTDSTAAIQAAIDDVSVGATILFPSGTYKATSQLLVSGKGQLTFLGERGAKLLFTDGAYIGLLFTNVSGQCLVENLMIHGTNNVSPAITLLKATGNSAYMTIQNCQFAFASIGVLLAQTYIMRMLNNNYAGCNTAFKATTDEGSVADLALIGETFGTCLIGSNPVVDIKYPTTRIVGCYWELQTNAKQSLYFQDGSQYATVSACQFEESGELFIGVSNQITISGCNFRNSHTNNRTIRVQGGSSAQITGNYLALTAPSASVVGLSVSGFANTVGNFFNNYLTGAAQGSGTISANTFANCTTGATATGVTVLSNDNQFSNCTTNVATNSTATALAPSFFTATLTGCTTSPTGIARYEVNNGVATLTIPDMSGTSNSTSCTITGLPVALQTTNNQFGTPALIIDNGTQSAEQVYVSGGTGTLVLRKNGSDTGFTNSGTKGIRGCTIVYRLRNVS